MYHYLMLALPFLFADSILHLKHALDISWQTVSGLVCNSCILNGKMQLMYSASHGAVKTDYIL